MTTHHTPEPWRANAAQADIEGPDGEEVAVCYCNDDDGSDAIANARRIVACVNACAGIPTEELESAGTIAVEVKDEMQDELLHVIRQRDELLDVINHIVNEVKLTSSQYELCRQALASVKGESK